MELRRLRYFVAVAEELSFGRAARRLNISQPPLSRQIQQLEDELGVVLFERTAVGVALTPPGETLLAGAREILLNLNRLQHRTQRVAKGEIGTLTVGFRETMMYSGILPAIFREFRERFPQVELVMEPLASIEQWNAVKEGKIYMGFVYTLPEHERLLASEFVFEDNFMIAINDSHRLARKQKLRLADLANEPFIWFPRSASPRYHDELLHACQGAGFTPKAVQLAPYIGGTAITLVSAGAGISFAQEASARLMRPPNVVLKRIEDLDVKVRCSVIWKLGASSPLLDGFLGVVRDKRRDLGK